MYVNSVRKESAFNSLMGKSIFVFCASLPLTAAFTINIGFPLKIYELIAMAWIVLWAINVLRNAGVIRVKAIPRHFFYITTAFLIVSLLSIVLGYYTLITEIPYTPWAVGKDSYLLSGVLKLIYYMINVFIFYFIIINYQKHQRNIVFGWVIGALFVSSFAVFNMLNALFFSGGVVLLPGMSESDQHGYISGVAVLRGGTFREGNYFSLYLFCTIMLSFYMYAVSKKRIFIFTIYMSSLAMIPTLSTLGILVLLTFYSWKVMVKKYASGYFNLVVKIIMFLFLVFFVVQFVISDFAESHLWNKLFLAESLWVQGSSLYDRLQTILFGIEIFSLNPFFGVGISNFPYYFDAEYKFGGKVIANNIYIELLSEGGFLLFVAFVSFIFLIVKRLLLTIKVNAENHFFLFAIFGILIQFMAYPSLTLTYLWVYFAIIVACTEAGLKNIGVVGDS